MALLSRGRRVLPTHSGWFATGEPVASYPCPRHSKGTNLLDWLSEPATDADRIRLARLLASGRGDAVTAALSRLASRRQATDQLGSWERSAGSLLAAGDRRRMRSAFLAEAARLGGGIDPAITPPSPRGRRRVGGGVSRYGPPPRLQGCRGKVIRWRPVPSAV